MRSGMGHLPQSRELHRELLELSRLPLACRLETGQMPAQCIDLVDVRRARAVAAAAILAADVMAPSAVSARAPLALICLAAPDSLRELVALHRIGPALLPSLVDPDVIERQLEPLRLRARLVVEGDHGHGTPSLAVTALDQLAADRPPVSEDQHPRRERVVDRQTPHDLPPSVAPPATRSWMTRAPPLLRSTPATTIRGRRSQTASRRASSSRRGRASRPASEYPQRPMVKPRTISLWPQVEQAKICAPSGRVSRTSTRSERQWRQKINALIVWTLLDAPSVRTAVYRVRYWSAREFVSGQILGVSERPVRSFRRAVPAPIRSGLPCGIGADTITALCEIHPSRGSEAPSPTREPTPGSPCGSWRRRAVCRMRPFMRSRPAASPDRAGQTSQ